MMTELSKLVDDTISYPHFDSHLPFSQYISECRELIKKRRPDLQEPSPYSGIILNANSPFELHPFNHAGGSKTRVGALLVHGLFDCPFSLRDLGGFLQNQGVFCRAVLLPGHGTTPSDLLTVHYQNWLDVVRYGIESFRDQVDKLFIVGYSTGAALAVYQALHYEQVTGLVMLAPCIKIKAPVNIIFNWHTLTKKLSQQREWIYQNDEIDYTKYLSIPFNPVRQVDALTKLVQVKDCKALKTPMFMAVSDDDETISAKVALDFFKAFHHPANKCLVYSNKPTAYQSKGMIARNSYYPDLQIKNFSHVALPFAPHNPHYGQHGDYAAAAHRDTPENLYGAYNHIEETASDTFYQLGIMKFKRRSLTYNPDFNFMCDQVKNFIQGLS